MTGAGGEAPGAAAPVVTLIDASGFIFRAYHALPPLSTSKGVPTNAVYGFCRMLMKTLRDFNPTHVALAFDKESRQGRLAIDANYKATRKETPPDLVPQFALIRRVAEVLNVPILEFEGWEADDVIGTLADQARHQGFHVLVVTGDKDFAQLVDRDVELYDPVQDRRMGPEEVRAKFGVRPSEIRDYLALVGDASDNVPKVPGVGPKTAAELIAEFGSVESLLERASQIAKPKIREAVLLHREQLLRAKQLVSLRKDLPLPTEISSLARRPMREPEARALFTELEFYKLLQEMPAAAPTPVASDATIVLERSALSEVAKLARAAGRLALVAAADGPPLDAQWVGLAMAVPGGRTFYLPLGHRLIGAPVQLGLEAVREVLGPVLASAEVKKSGHDLKALTVLLAAAGIDLWGVDADVELLSYLLNPSRREHALQDVARERLNVELPVLPAAKGARKERAPFAELTVEEAARCFGAYAAAALRLGEALWPEVDSAKLGKVAREIELPLVPILARMERVGVKVDRTALEAIGKKVEAECQKHLEEVYRLAGHSFNVSSNAQLADVLYTRMGLPVLKKGKTGPSTDQEVLEKLAELHPVARAIMEYRTVLKLQNTYLAPLPALIAKDGRLHTTFRQTATATGRLSSVDPNLQNIPVRSELGKEIRAAFIAEPGNLLVSADYSQIELRILAHVAEDPALIEAFSRDEDVHTRTASEVFGVSAPDVTPEQRRAAKAVNFGIAYGLSPHGLSARLGIPEAEAKLIIERYFARYRGIRRYLDETIERARSVGYVETLFGRRRYTPDVLSRNRNAAQAAERAAINMPIQGTAADLMKLAMIRAQRALDKEGFSTSLLLQVHDELLFEGPEDEAARVKELARVAMGGVLALKVPLRVDVGSGLTWAEAH